MTVPPKVDLSLLEMLSVWLERGWTVKEYITIEHINTARTRVVHVDRLLQQCLVKGEVQVLGEPQSGVSVAVWEAPHFEYFVLPQA